jgi:hypothetical protein
VSGPAIQHFVARGGKLVHLVSLVYLVCLVRLVGERNKPDKPEQLNKQEQPADPLALLPYAISHMLFSSCPPPTQGSGTLPLINTALRFPQAPPRMGLPARPLCPSRFAPSVASPCTAPSHTTLAPSRAKAPCGISPVPAGVSLAICHAAR